MGQRSHEIAPGCQEDGVDLKIDVPEDPAVRCNLSHPNGSCKKTDHERRNEGGKVQPALAARLDQTPVGPGKVGEMSYDELDHQYGKRQPQKKEQVQQQATVNNAPF